MAKTLVYNREVFEEIDMAIEVGQQEWPELVDGLLEELEARISYILQNPTLHPPFQGELRRINLRKRFPYHIIYEPLDDEIRILAFAHHRDLPLYWEDRID